MHIFLNFLPVVILLHILLQTLLHPTLPSKVSAGADPFFTFLSPWETLGPPDVSQRFLALLILVWKEDVNNRIPEDKAFSCFFYSKDVLLKLNFKEIVNFHFLWEEPQPMCGGQRTWNCRVNSGHWAWQQTPSPAEEPSHWPWIFMIYF